MKPVHSNDGVHVFVSDDEQENSYIPYVSLEPLSQHLLQLWQKGTMTNNYHGDNREFKITVYGER